MIYRIFDLALKSTIPLPELPQENSRPAELFFRLFPRPGSCSPEPQWLHHWSLPDGKITISCGKTANHYWLRFPDLADFKLNVASGQIDGYSHADIPNSTISHLLLDQVIPRLVTHRGRPVLHASCVQIDDFAILFLGESGWGKSTLAAHFHKEGYSLLTDDCLLIERMDNQAIGTPGYSGARLWDDSLQVVANDQETSAVSNYNSKRRILFPHTPGPVPPKPPFTPSSSSTILTMQLNKPPSPSIRLPGQRQPSNS